MAETGIAHKPVGSVRLSACVYNTALAFPACAGKVPLTDTTAGRAQIDVHKAGSLQVLFAGTDTENETFGYLVVGWVKAVLTASGQSGWVPVTLAEGVATLGATATGTGGTFIESATALVADTITETTTNPLSIVYSPGGDRTAALLIDVTAYHYVTVHVSRNGQTAATMDVILVAGDRLSGLTSLDPDVTLGDVDLVSGGNAMTILGTMDTDTGNIAGSTATCATKLGTIDTDTGNMATLLGTIDADTSTIAGNTTAIQAAVEATLAARLTHGKTLTRAAISAASSGDNELVAAVATEKIKVVGLMLLAKEAVDATLYTDVQASGDALTGALSLADNEGFVLPPASDPTLHWIETAAGESLNLYLSAAKQVSGCVVYYTEA